MTVTALRSDPPKEGEMIQPVKFLFMKMAKKASVETALELQEPRRDDGIIYYKISKSIAFTDLQDIGQCKTVRLLKVGEVLKLLQGPVTDEPNALLRILAISCNHSNPTMRWITLRGSQGTTYLERCPHTGA